MEDFPQATLSGSTPHFLNHCLALLAYTSPDHRSTATQQATPPIPCPARTLHTVLAPVGTKPHPGPQLIGLGQRLAWRAANLHGRAGLAEIGRTNQIPPLRPYGEKQRGSLARTVPRGRIGQRGSKVQGEEARTPRPKGGEQEAGPLPTWPARSAETEDAGRWPQGQGSHPDIPPRSLGPRTSTCCPAGFHP